MFNSLSTSLIARGILAVIIGITALAWPSVTVLAQVIVFAAYAFIASGMEAARGSPAATPGRSSGICCSAWSTWPPGWSPWCGRGPPRWSWS
jgi:hypothetical protein